jgi:hypothetical protein
LRAKLSISIFDSSRFRLIQNYQSQESSCAIQGNTEASERNKKIVQGLIGKVLEETSSGISEEHVEAYESFLSNIEAIDGEYSSLNYGNPFSDSIAQMQDTIYLFSGLHLYDPVPKTSVERLKDNHYRADYPLKQH